MLNRHYIRGTMRTGQRGVVLFIALIVLVAMTLAAIALMRSVDTTNIIAGNLAFQQAATHSGDTAVESAIGWLEDCNNSRNGCNPLVLNGDDNTHGYIAAGNSATRNPSGSQNWDAFWTANVGNGNSHLVGTDTALNTTRYIIDRLCNGVGAPASSGGSANCASSPLIIQATGNAQVAGQIPLQAASLVFYRITVRTAGQVRNTVSYIQVMVAL